MIGTLSFSLKVLIMLCNFFFFFFFYLFSVQFFLFFLIKLRSNIIQLKTQCSIQDPRIIGRIMVYTLIWNDSFHINMSIRGECSIYNRVGFYYLLTVLVTIGSGYRGSRGLVVHWCLLHFTMSWSATIYKFLRATKWWMISPLVLLYQLTNVTALRSIAWSRGLVHRQTFVYGKVPLLRSHNNNRSTTKTTLY